VDSSCWNHGDYTRGGSCGNGQKKNGEASRPSALVSLQMHGLLLGGWGGGAGTIPFHYAGTPPICSVKWSKKSVGRAEPNVAQEEGRRVGMPSSNGMGLRGPKAEYVSSGRQGMGPRACPVRRTILSAAWNDLPALV